MGKGRPDFIAAGIAQRRKIGRAMEDLKPGDYVPKAVVLAIDLGVSEAQATRHRQRYIREAGWRVEYEPGGRLIVRERPVSLGA